MAKIKSKDTIPELKIRKTLCQLGYRYKYRLHVKKLMGNPDIVIPKKKIILFINGCFWHQHTNCKRAIVPKSNKSYWKNKLRNNISRQKKHIESLKRDGWKVKIIWECQINNNKNLSKELERILNG